VLSIVESWKLGIPAPPPGGKRRHAYHDEEYGCSDDQQEYPE
jgi:hypothetical protein